MTAIVQHERCAAAHRALAKAVGHAEWRASAAPPGEQPAITDIDQAAAQRIVEEFLAEVERFAGATRYETAALIAEDGLGSPQTVLLTTGQGFADGLTAGTSAYADSCPVHLVSATSLHALNARVTANGGHPVPASRFRPNIVVDDWPAHEEDHALHLTTGTVELAYAKPAIRCAVTTVDQSTGTRTGPEPLRTLATYRGYVRTWVVPFLGRYRLSKLRAEHIEAMYDAMKNAGRSDATVRQVHAIVKKSLFAGAAA